MRLSVQCFTLRDEFERDVAATLREIASIGFGYIETAGTYGLTAPEFAAMIRDAGLKVSGMHVGLDAVEGGLAATLEEAEALNAYHVIVPWVGADTYADGWDALGQRLERAGRQVAAAGKSLAYHNHAFEFVREPHERTGFDQLFAAADSAFLKAEIDVWWAHCGGEDPAELIRTHGKRARLIHLKDGSSCADDVHRPAGQGVLDWDSILLVCGEVGAEFGVIELDRSPGSAMEAVRASFKFFQSKGLS